MIKSIRNWLIKSDEWFEEHYIIASLVEGFCLLGIATIFYLALIIWS
tara:strand:- start:6315 stop:6455 length:141 start_codon:yes stop_codon:yes gene_type:complete